MENGLTVVYGSKWCGDCYRAKRVLDNYQIIYEWIDVYKDKEAKKFVSEVNIGNIVVPTIVFQDGSILVEPSTLQLKQKLGLENE